VTNPTDPDETRKMERLTIRVSEETKSMLAIIKEEDESWDGFSSVSPVARETLRS